MTKRNLLGLGIYYPAEAARLIRIHPARLRRWVRGYTYWTYEDLKKERLHRRPPVLHDRKAGDIPVMDHRVALSFLELMELCVVAELVDRHRLPLQSVRKLGSLAALEFSTRYPFASRHWYVEGHRVFASLSRLDRETAVEIHPGRIRQVTLPDVFRPTLQDVDFNPETSLVRRWWPMGKSRPIVMDPRVNFGSPTILDTRLLTTVVAAMAKVGSAEEAVWAYGVAPDAVNAACEFEDYLAAA